MAKHRKISKGDRVSWRSHGGTALGTVKRKLTRRTRAAGRTVDASPEQPQFEVERHHARCRGQEAAGAAIQITD